MKYTLLALLLVFSLVITGCASMGRAAENIDRTMHNAEDAVESALQPEIPVATPSVTASSGEITPEEARDIALNHAGLTADQVKYLRTDYEIDDGMPQYEVTFHFERWEYDYEIDARTGNVLSFEKDD